MNLNLKERKLVLKWFDIAVECEELKDVDLRLYDKIRESVQDDDDANDPLVYNPRKGGQEEDYDDYEEECHYDMDNFSDEDY